VAADFTENLHAQALASTASATDAQSAIRQIDARRSTSAAGCVQSLLCAGCRGGARPRLLVEVLREVGRHDARRLLTSAIIAFAGNREVRVSEVRRTHESVKQTILGTVLELLPRIGYDRLTLDLVARKAGAYKATIYRHWPEGKSELVRCAVALHLAQADFAPVEPTGELRYDLVNMTRRVCAWQLYRYPLVVVLSPLVFHHEVFDPSREHARAECAAGLGAIVKAAQRRESSAPARRGNDVDTLLFTQAAALLHALVWDRLSADAIPDDAFVEETVDNLLLPLLRTWLLAPAPEHRDRKAILADLR
jgi:AcrR family transcriptional regulator